MAEEDTVVGERLADLGRWELYRFLPRNSDEVVCTVALLPSEVEVTYGVYRGNDAEPSASGAIVRDAGAWSNTTRESVLRDILAAYRPELPELAAGVDVDLPSPPGEP